MQQALKDCNGFHTSACMEEAQALIQLSQGWLMYVDMSMLEWVDHTQMAPEAGVVDAAQTNYVDASYRSDEYTFAAMFQHFEESRLASKIWQHV